MKAKLARTAFEYGVITVATLLLVVGVYFLSFQIIFIWRSNWYCCCAFSNEQSIGKFLHIYYQYGASGVGLFILRKKF